VCFSRTIATPDQRIAIQSGLPRHAARSAAVWGACKTGLPSCLRIAMGEKHLKQCGLCARWTADGEDVPSGNRDPKTGTTPIDNFVCHRCQKEARALNLLGKATEKWLLEHRAVA
jgi:hypothetical protein